MRYYSLCLLVPMMMLAACSSDVKGELGMRRDAPDEFRVVSEPPLTLPPDFSQLPAPTNAAPPPAASVASLTGIPHAPASASAVIPMARTQGNEQLSAGDQALLKKSGATHVDPSIRDQIVKDNQPVPENKGFIKTLLTPPPPPTPPSVVDAAAEKQRILDNKKANQPVTTGDTPSVSDQKSIFDRIFGGSKDDE